MEPAPQVYKNSSALAATTSGWKKRLPLILFGLLIIVVLAEGAYVLNTFFTQKKVDENNLKAEISSLSTPQIVANTSKKNFGIGENIPVTIKVVTGGNPTDSADLVLKYDPKFLEAEGNSFVNIGRIYPEYPVANFDNIRGLVQISGTNLSSDQSFSGIGTFATLNFKAKSTGPTTIAVEYQPDSTADSNLVLSGSTKDILAQVTNADIIITESTIGTNNNDQSASCNGYFQYCQVGEKTGKQFCQRGQIKENVCSFDPELTVSCSDCEIK